MKIWTVIDDWNEEIAGSWTAEIDAMAEAESMLQEIIENDEVFDADKVITDIEYTMMDGLTYVKKAVFKYEDVEGRTIRYMIVQANELTEGV